MMLDRNEKMKRFRKSVDIAMDANALRINVDDADRAIVDILGHCRTEKFRIGYDFFNASPHTTPSRLRLFQCFSAYHSKREGRDVRNAGSVINGKGKGAVNEADIPVLVGRCGNCGKMSGRRDGTGERSGGHVTEQVEDDIIDLLGVGEVKAYEMQAASLFGIVTEDDGLYYLICSTVEKMTSHCWVRIWDFSPVRPKRRTCPSQKFSRNV